MVSDYLQKVKQRIYENKTDLCVALAIFFVGMASFGLGRLSVLWQPKTPLIIEENQNKESIHTESTKNDTSASFSDSKSSAAIIQGKYVASKSGTAYHYPWCSGAQRIKEENKIWFDTKEEAEKKGYKPAGNCSGL